MGDKSTSKVHSTKGNKPVEDIAKSHGIDSDAQNWSTADWKKLNDAEREEVNKIADTQWTDAMSGGGTGMSAGGTGMSGGGA
jgi:hypothetical protein